ncbi:MAG: alpha/beta hydrolase [Myxococcales bacterium]|nr:alpha/beta hydrolase [Myxococcales bacterium]
MASREFTRALRSIRAWALQARRDDGGLDLEGLRDATDGGFLPVPKTTKVTPTQLGGRAAEWIVDAQSDPSRRLLYLHGGGFVAGGLASHRPLIAAIARASGCVALGVDYRLAPEHPFPAAIDDCVAAWEHVRGNGPEGPGPAARCFVGGDSAGGGLTLSCMIAARDRGLPLPDAAFTLSAYTDWTSSGASMRSRAEVDPVIGLKMIPETRALYLQGADPEDPLASPLFADPTGLPPLLMQVGDHEVLRDDTVRFAEAARARGVDVTLEVWPEMIHCWQLFGDVFPEARAAIERVGAYLRAPPSTSIRS